MTKMLDNTPKWISATQAAALCGFTTRTLRFFEDRGGGPPVYRYPNGRLRYCESEVREWIMSQRNVKASA